MRTMATMASRDMHEWQRRQISRLSESEQDQHIEKNSLLINNEENSSDILCRLNALRKARQYCDVTLMVGRVEVSVHKAVLASASSVLNELFLSKKYSDQKHIKLPGISYNAFEYLVDYIYTGRLETDDIDQICELYDLAGKLNMTRVRSACSQYLMDPGILPDTCLSFRLCASRFRDREVIQFLDQYIQDNFGVYALSEFGQLPRLLVTLYNGCSAATSTSSSPLLSNVISSSILSWYRDLTDADLDRYSLAAATAARKAATGSSSSLASATSIKSAAFQPSRKSSGGGDVLENGRGAVRQFPSFPDRMVDLWLDHNGQSVRVMCPSEVTAANSGVAPFSSAHLPLQNGALSDPALSSGSLGSSLPVVVNGFSGGHNSRLGANDEKEDGMVSDCSSGDGSSGGDRASETSVASHVRENRTGGVGYMNSSNDHHHHHHPDASPSTNVTSNKHNDGAGAGYFGRFTLPCYTNEWKVIAAIERTETKHLALAICGGYLMIIKVSIRPSPAALQPSTSSPRHPITINGHSDAGVEISTTTDSVTGSTLPGESEAAKTSLSHYSSSSVAADGPVPASTASDSRTNSIKLHNCGSDKQSSATDLELTLEELEKAEADYFNDPNDLITGGVDDSVTPPGESDDTLPRMKLARSALGVAHVNSKSIAAIGGYNKGNCLDSVEVYNTGERAWNCSEMASLLDARGRFGYGEVCGRIFVCGGSTGARELKSVECYDPDPESEGGGVWTRLADLNLARSSLGVAELNSVLYCAGGWSGQSGMKQCEVYDPHINKWSPIAKLAIGRSQAAVCAEQGGGGGSGSGNRVFVCGGSDSWISYNTVETYDPRVGKWASAHSMNTPRRGASCQFFKDRLYVIGGSDGTNYLDTVEVFDPRNNFWQFSKPMACPRANLASIVVDGSGEEELYALGGFSGQDFLDDIEVVSSLQ